MRAIMVDAVGHDRPTVISAFFDVDFVSAFWAVFVIQIAPTGF
jgi:hypothetical protein